MTENLRPLAFRLAALPLALAFGLAACAPAEGPAPPTAATPADAPKVDEPAPAEPPAPPRPPIATATTDWPTLEARLIRAMRTGALVQVEVELANVGAAPVTIEGYSAREATLTDDASKDVVEPFATDGPPSATHDLTATIPPGEKAVVSAAFPLPGEAERVTIAFPRIDTFPGVAVELPHAPAPPPRQRRNRNASNADAN